MEDTDRLDQLLKEKLASFQSTQNNEPKIVYQIIERAVPGEKGEKGDKGDSGNSTVISSGISGAQYNGVVDPNFAVKGQDANFKVLSTDIITTQTATITNLQVADLNGTTLNFGGIVSASATSATTTSGAVIASTTQTNSLSANNASLTSASSTNLFSQLLTVLTTIITSLTATNASITNATATQLTTSFFNATSSLVQNSTTTNLSATNVNISGGSIQNATITNNFYFATGTVASATIANANLGNATTSNLVSANASITQASSTNLFASILNALTAVFSSIIGTNSTVTNATSTNFFASLANFTSSTITNLLVTGATLTSATSTNLVSTNFNTTNLSTTNQIASNATITNSTTTNLSAGNVNISGGSIQNATITQNFYVSATSTFTATSTFATTTAASSSIVNLNAQTTNTANLLTTSATLTNATATNLSAVSASATNLSAANATLTNATSTSLFSTLLQAATSIFTSLTAGNATLTSATSTNLFASIFQAVAGTFTNLVAGNATLTSATTSNLATGNFTATGAVNLGIQNGWLYGDASGAIVGSSSPTVGYITATTSTSTFKGIWMDGSIVPLLDNVYSLGSPSKRFKDLYVASSTIYIDNVGLSNNNGILTWAGSGVFASTTSGSSTLGVTSITELTNTLATISKATITNLFANSLTTGLTNGFVIRGNSANISEATSTLFISDNGRIGIGTTNPSGTLTINSGVLAGLAQEMLALTGTWNNAGSVFKGINLDVTNTAAHSNSTLFNLALSGSSVFKVSGAGDTTISGNLGVTGTTTLNKGIDMSSNKIVNLALPTNNTDAASKGYVDGIAQGISWKAPVLALSSTTIAASSTGDRYIIVAGSVGTGCALNSIAQNIGSGSWTCETPATGTSVFVDQGLDTNYNFNGTTWISLGSTVNHANLIGLQGGTAGEYYHLNAAQYGNLNSVNAQLDQLKTTGTATQFVNLTLTGGLNVSGGTAGATITNATFTNIYASSLASATSLFGTNAQVGNATLTNASSTSFFASLFQALSAIITNLTATNLLAANATTTNATSTSAYISSLLSAATANITTLFATTGTITGLTTTNATLTSATATTLVIGSASVTNLTVGGNNVTALVSGLGTSLTTQTLNASTTNASTSNATNLSATTATLTNATATNLVATNASTTNLLATNATLSGATSTSLYATVLQALTAIFTNLIATSATFTSATSTNFAISGAANLSGTTTLATTSLTAALRDVTGTSGTTGQVLTSTGTSTIWSTISSAGLPASTTSLYVGTNGGVAIGTTTNEYGGSLSQGLTLGYLTTFGTKIADVLTLFSATSTSNVATATNALYNVGGTLYFNGSSVSPSGVTATAAVAAVSAQASGTANNSWATVGTSPKGIARDSQGNFYVANNGGNTISKITSAGVVTLTWATVGFQPYGVAVDASDNVYVANNSSNTISKITPAGVVTSTWATVGSAPTNLVFDNAGNLYVANNGSNTISKITPAGVVTLAWATVGTNPYAMVFDTSGNMYVTISGGNSVSKVTPAGSVTTNWASTSAGPKSIVIDGSGNLFVTNFSDSTITKITSAGVSTVTWVSMAGGTSPQGIAIDSQGNLFVASSGFNRLVMVTSAGSVTPAWATVGSNPYAVLLDSSGILYVTNTNSGTVSKITGAATPAVAGSVAITSATTIASSTTITATTTLATTTISNALGISTSTNAFGGALTNGITLGYTTQSGTNNANVLVLYSATSTSNIATSSNALYNVGGALYFNGSAVSPSGLTSTAAVVGSFPTTGTPSTLASTCASSSDLKLDSQGNLYVACSGSGSVLKITPAGVVSTYANFGTSYSLAFDTAGNLYVGNASNLISKVTTGGASSTFATVGSTPQALAFDSAGNLYTANYSSDTVSKVTPGGVVTTFATLPASSGPNGLVFDSSGNLYVTNQTSGTVSKVTPGGVVTTFATVGATPRSPVFDDSGNLYVANESLNTIKKVTPGGVVTTFATISTGPYSLTFDTVGNLYAAISGSDLVSRITPGGAVTTFATTGTGPIRIVIDSTGNIYTLNQGSNTISKITGVVNAVAGSVAISSQTSITATTTLATTTINNALGISTTTNQYGGALTNGITLGYTTSAGTNLANTLVLYAATSTSNVATTTNAIYNVNGSLYFNGSTLSPSGVTGTESSTATSATSTQVTSGAAAARVDLINRGNNLPAGMISVSATKVDFIDCVDASCSSFSTSTIFSAATNEYSEIDMAKGSDGYPIFAFRTVPGADVKFVKCNNFSCTSTSSSVTIDSTNSVGYGISLAIGLDGLPIMSYFDDTADSLKVAKCSDVNCSSSTITSIVTGLTGNLAISGTSIAIGTDGRPLVGFIDITSTSGRIARCSNNTCTSISSNISLQTGFPNGGNTDVTIGSNGVPLIAMSENNASTWGYHFRRCTTSACVNSTNILAGTDGSFIEESGMAVLTNGFPVLYYNDRNSSGFAKVRVCKDITCSSSDTYSLSPALNGQQTKSSKILVSPNGTPILGGLDTGTKPRIYTIGGITSTTTASVSVAADATISSSMTVAATSTFGSYLTASKIGVGIIDSTYSLAVSGTTCLDQNGDGVCTDTTSAISDARLKQNVATMTDALSIVQRLRGVFFDWKADNEFGASVGDAHSLGFIAQEVEQALPGLDLVSTTTAGYKVLDYQKLVAVNTMAINELAARLAEASTTYAVATGTRSTTTVASLLTKAPTIASSTATTSTTTIEVLNIEDLDPFAGVFADVSEPLKNTLNSMASSTVRVFDTAIFAMTGIFNEVIARVVRTDLLCIRNECINDTQLHSLVELLHGAQSLAPGGASSTEPFWQEPVPAPGVASTSVPTAEPANDLTNGGAGVSTSATPLSESPSTPLSQNPELEPATPIQTPTNNETGEPGGVTPTN